MSRFLITTTLFVAGLLSLTTVGQKDPKPQGKHVALTGVDLQLPVTAFGGAIEAAAVNAKGDVFAADFVGGGANASSAFGFFSQAEGGTANVLAPNKNPLFTASPDGVAKPPLIAGARFLPDDQLLLTDAANQRVISVKCGQVSIFCSDAKMLQPNDLAVSTRRPTLIFLSGQNYTADTVAGASGDLWTCDGGNATRFDPQILAEAHIHRTNGIETSADGRFLYISSAVNVAGAVVKNRIYRFTLSDTTGKLLPKPPVILYEFIGADAAIDIDGMRTDADGNLFVARNGAGQIVKISDLGELLSTITLPGMGGPSNLEFGGPQGKTLFAIGKCAANATVGCAASLDTDSVGKAFEALQQQ